MNVILIDDEQLALDFFTYQLHSISNVNIIGKFTDPFLGKQMIEKEAVDMVFLDIDMPDVNGIELAEKLLERKPNLPIVFVTAYDEYAVKAFELNAIDYILKPVSTDRLNETIKRVDKNQDHQPQANKHIHPSLQLNLFKQVGLLRNPQNNAIPLKPLKWRTTKVEQLFLYFVQHHGEKVDKTVLIDLLWPDTDMEKAYQQLYTAIYNIRKTLKNYHTHFNLSNQREGYQLTLTDISIDTEQFDIAIQTLPPLSLENISIYDTTLDIYTGDYLAGFDYIWAEGKRQRLQTEWIQLVFKVLNFYEQYHLHEKARTLSLRLCEWCPLEEEGHFYLMKAYAATNNFTAAYQQYKRLEEILYDELAVTPRSDITHWYTNLLQENR